MEMPLKKLLDMYKNSLFQIRDKIEYSENDHFNYTWRKTFDNSKALVQVSSILHEKIYFTKNDMDKYNQRNY